MTGTVISPVPIKKLATGCVLRGHIATIFMAYVCDR